MVLNVGIFSLLNVELHVNHLTTKLQDDTNSNTMK